MILHLAWSTLLTLLLVAAVIDWRTRTIPNAIPLAVIGLYVIAAIFVPQIRAAWWLHLASFAIMFTIGLVLFATGAMGGGDVKLMAALALWHPLDQLALLVLAIGISGGVLGIVYAIHERRVAGSWTSALKVQLPYGIAIFLGELIMIALVH